MSFSLSISYRKGAFRKDAGFQGFLCLKHNNNVEKIYFPMVLKFVILLKIILAIRFLAFVLYC